MADNSGTLVLRTTSDGAGRPVGVIIGVGATPVIAVGDLGGHARREISARNLAGSHEVVDVRLVQGGTETWTAIGTLCQLPDRNYWDEPGR